MQVPYLGDIFSRKYLYELFEWLAYWFLVHEVLVICVLYFLWLIFIALDFNSKFLLVTQRSLKIWRHEPKIANICAYTIPLDKWWIIFNACLQMSSWVYNTGERATIWDDTTDMLRWWLRTFFFPLFFFFLLYHFYFIIPFVFIFIFIFYVLGYCYLVLSVLNFFFFFF